MEENDLRKTMRNSSATLALLLLVACTGDEQEPVAATIAEPPGSATGEGSARPDDERPASPAPADSSRLSLDWPGTYSGVVPCASCPGIETVVTLNDDGTFERAMRYIDESPVPVVERGAFEWNERGSAVTLNPADGHEARYQVGEHRLFQLDSEGARIDGALADRYVLHQHIDDPRVENRRWRLVELNGVPVDANEVRDTPFVQLDSSEDRVYGSAGCNRFSGSYAIKTGQRIEFAESLAMTMMACPGSDIEPAFVEALRVADNYSLGGDGTMTLNRARMAPLARFVETEDESVN